MPDNGERAEIDWKNRKVTLYGQMIQVLTLGGVCALLVATFFIIEGLKLTRTDFIAAIRDQASASRENAGVNRESNKLLREQICLLSLDQHLRQQQEWRTWCRERSQ